MHLGLSSEEAKLRLLIGIQNKEFWALESCYINSIVQDWLKKFPDQGLLPKFDLMFLFLENTVPVEAQ